MIEFLKNLSGITSSMIGVIFAFLIGKILGYEEILNNIEENENIKIKKIEEIKIDIRNIGISESEYNDAKNEVFKEFIEIILNETDKSDKEIIKDLIKEKKLFFLDLDFLEKELEKYFQEEEKKILKNLKYRQYYELLYIKDNLSEKYPSIKLMKKYSSIIHVENIKSFIEELIKKRIEDKMIENSAKLEFQENKELTYSSFTLPYINIDRDISIIKALIEKYELELEALKEEKEKLKYIYKEKKMLKRIIVILYIVFIFGIIYPLSFLKFTESDVLDFSLHRNFMTELFTQSGLMLFCLTFIVTLCIGAILKILSKKIINKNLKDLDKFNDWILISYMEYKKY